MIYFLPIFILFAIFAGMLKKVKCFDSFVSGAKDGIATVVKLVPSLIGLIVAVGVFKESGISDIIIKIFEPILSKIGINKEIFPLVIIRPISGSASLATLKDIISTNGPDSYAARTACVMMGSTETIFYTLAVYTEKSKIKKAPGVLPAALIANIISAIAAGLICSVI